MNIFNTLIFSGSLLIIFYSIYDLFRTKWDNKISRYFIWFVITGCIEIFQLISLDNGLAQKIPIIYLLFMPFQFLSPFYFGLFTFHYLQMPEKISKYRYVLLTPFLVFSVYYAFLKINYILGLPFISQKTVNFVSAEVEENFTVVFLFVIGVWLYKIVRDYEGKREHLPFAYVKRQTKWLRNTFLSIIILCVLWTINILYIYQLGVKSASNYYALWIAFLLFYLVSSIVSRSHFTKINEIRKKGLKVVNDAVDSFKVKESDRIEISEHTSNHGSGKPIIVAHHKNTESISQSVNSLSSLDTEFLQKITQVVEDNISNSELNVDFLLNEMCISRTQLHRRLKSLTGLSTSGFIRMIRMKTAKKLIEKEKSNLKRISYDVGYSDPSYFAKCFKSEFSISPSEYASGLKTES